MRSVAAWSNSLRRYGLHHEINKYTGRSEFVFSLGLQP